MDNQEDLDEGKIVYDWSPPTGKKQNFFYKGAAIDREHVIYTHTCTQQQLLSLILFLGQQDV